MRALWFELWYLEVHIEIWNMGWDSSNLGEYLTFNLKSFETSFSKTERVRVNDYAHCPIDVGCTA